jgi:hypothetical protein
MKLTTENSSTTTKWRAPYIVHYIRDRERFQTQLLSGGAQLKSPGWCAAIGHGRTPPRRLYTVHTDYSMQNRCEAPESNQPGPGESA